MNLRIEWMSLLSAVALLAACSMEVRPDVTESEIGGECEQVERHVVCEDSHKVP